MRVTIERVPNGYIVNVPVYKESSKKQPEDAAVGFPSFFAFAYGGDSNSYKDDRKLENRQFVFAQWEDMAVFLGHLFERVEANQERPC